jgi:hypothetical protein
LDQENKASKAELQLLHPLLQELLHYLSQSEGDRTRNAKVYDEKLYRLRTREGMSKVLMSMSIYRDGYNCLRPWKLLHKEYGHKCFRVERIIDIAAGGKPVHV